VNSFTKGLGATANARDLPLVQGRSAITDAIREMATLRLSQRRPLPLVSSPLEHEGGIARAAAALLDDGRAGYDFVVREAELEGVQADIRAELATLAWATITVADDAESVGLTLEGDDEERARASYLKQEVRAGLGRATAIELEPVEHRASLRRFQAEAESHIAMRVHDSPHWDWKQPVGPTPDWYHRERQLRDAVLTELRVYAEPGEDGDEAAAAAQRLGPAAPGRSCMRGSRGVSSARRGVTWARLSGSIASSTMGMCGLRCAAGAVARATDPDLEGVEMGVADVEDLLGAAVHAQTARDLKRKREGRGDDAGSTALTTLGVNAVTAGPPAWNGHGRSAAEKRRRNKKNSKKQHKGGGKREK
jgi:hypothetical protein